MTTTPTDDLPTALAVLYLRVSTAGQAEGGTSLETQEATGRAEAARRSAQVVAVHSDEISGALYSRRAGLQAALLQVEALRRDHPGIPLCLIVAKYDRSARDITIQREIERRLRACGAEFVSCDGTPGGNTPPAKLFRTMRGGFAEFERDLIRERTVEGRLEVARSGRQPAPHFRPFGYRIIQRADVYPGSAWSVEDVGRYVVVPEEADLIRELFARYGSGEWSLRGAVREWIARGVPTVHDGRWWPPTLWWMLQNPVYVGRARYNRREHTRTEREDGTIAHGQRRRDPADVVTIPCPAIVSEATFALVQARLTSNQKTMGSTPARRHLLSGLLRCPECGRGLFGRRRESDGAFHYKCAQGTRDGGCSRRHWQGEVLERLVTLAVGEIAASPEIVALAIAEARGRQRVSVADLAGLEKLLLECQRKESLIVQAEITALSEGRDTSPYRAALREVGAKRVQIEEQVLRARVAVDSKAADVDVAEVVAAIGAIDQLLRDPRLPLLERAIALRTVVASVRPFDAEPGRDGRCNPVPGVEIEFHAVDGVERITLRATLSTAGGVTLRG